MAGLPKLSYEFVNNYFKKHGCTLLEKEYKNCKQLMFYRCKCGKKRLTCFNNFSRGHQCLICLNKKFEKSRKRRRQRLELRAKLYTVFDVATMLNVPAGDLYKAIYEGRLPGPKHRVGMKVRKYYNEADLINLAKLVE